MRGSSSSLSSSPRIQSSKSKNISIDDLPDAVLIEILCRLSCNILISQCKRVCKLWFNLISDPYFIQHFLHRRRGKKTPIIRTLIDHNAEELNGIFSWSKVLTPVRKRLKSFHSFEDYFDFCLNNDPIVVGTYNDLILCCGNNYCSNDYYICNPYTMQWVALPPTPTNPTGHVRVGFICDSPCYNYKEEKGHGMQHNAEYRCKVVRILPPVEASYYDSYKLDLEIFSTETGEWREAVVKCQVGINLHNFISFSFAYHGKLYWLDVKNYNDRLRVIGLNPFSDDDGVEGNFSYIAVDERLSDSGYFCACGGCMRMCGVEDRSLIVLDLKEEENCKLCLSKRMVYTLDQNMYPDASYVKLLHLHPNNEDENEVEDVFYLFVDGDIVMYNIRTGKWSDEMAEKRPHKCYYCCSFPNRRSFPIVLPWWPTPVPRLPQQAEQQLPHGRGTNS